MRETLPAAIDPQIAAALEELRGTIRGRYPGATFEVGEGEDPGGIYMRATVDVEDTDDVVDVFVDRLLEMQVEQGLPIYVVPVRPLGRVGTPRRPSKPAGRGSIPPPRG